MPFRRSAFLFLALLVALPLTLARCGGNPASPSPGGIVLRGTVLGTPAGSASLSALSARSAAASPLTVTVQGTAISTTVGDDGTFTLRGLPEGSFTLVFSSGGTTLGTLTLSGLLPNQEITITVKVDSSSVTLLEEQRNGIGHGDVEIEGVVTAVISLQPAADSRFTIAGKTVVARPGATAIREGNRARTVADLTTGTHVHVKGVWLPADASGQAVLAEEIVLQAEDGENEGPGASPSPAKTCMIEGGVVGSGVELEGSVVAGASAAFTMKVQGNRSSGNIAVDASGATFKCNGFKGTLAECQATVKSGAKVHVSGTLTSCDLASAAAQARQVMVQK